MLPGDSLIGTVSHVPVLDSEATVSLLARARGGDDEALNHLLERCLPPLRRWAHGRLPPYARDAQDTADLVQDTVIAALRRIDRLEARREGALQAYLRQALHNRIVDLIRQRRRRPDGTDLPEDLRQEGPSPLDAANGAENTARYEECSAASARRGSRGDHRRGSSCSTATMSWRWRWRSRRPTRRVWR